MQRNKKLELAWAAGFFDGEGFIGLVKNNSKRTARRYMRLTMALSQNYKQPLERFMNAVDNGSIQGPYMSNNGKMPHYRWTVSGDKAALVIVEKLMPFLSEPKQKQAKNAIEKYNDYRKEIELSPLPRGPKPKNLQRE